MRYQIWTQYAAIIAVVSASPHRIVKREDYTNDPNGNIKLTFSDETTTIGTISTDDIVTKLSEACSTQGQCDTNSINFSGDLNVGHTRESITLTVDPSGAYPSDKHDILIEVLKSSVKAIAKCETVDSGDVSCTGPIIGTQSGNCIESFKLTQCTVPKYWGVNYQPPGQDNAAPPFIGADLTVTQPANGFCATFSTIASAVAGAVGAVAPAVGGPLSLASLACL